MACSRRRRATTSAASPNSCTRKRSAADHEAARPATTLGEMAPLGVVLATFGSAVTADDANAAGDTRVVAGMLHSEPSLTGALDSLAQDGVTRIVVIALAPQYSPIIL